MRTRFLAVIFAVLTVTIALVSFVHFHFFKIERMEQIDSQIEQAAAVIYGSDFGYKEIEDPADGNDQIADLLGQASINLVVVLRDLKGKVLFENGNAELLEESFGVDQQWQTIDFEHHVARVLTLRLEKRRKILQVGLILNQSLLRWRTLNQRIAAYVLAILLAVTGVSLFLRRQLLKPLVRLAERLQAMTSDIQAGVLEQESHSGDAPVLQQPRDEFEVLRKNVEELTKVIGASFHSTKLWSAQMVHELKTPVTIIRANLESAARGARDPELRERLAASIQELDTMAGMVDSFMGWLAFENQVHGRGDLHVLKLDKIVQERIQALGTAYPDRIRFSGSPGSTLLTDPEYFRQLFDNLVNNALKYSPAGSVVEVEVSSQMLRISDRGPGIPGSVLRQLGKPFNRPSLRPKEGAPRGEKGCGLGLAWVAAICKTYGWTLAFDVSGGTSITVKFPRV